MSTANITLYEILRTDLKLPDIKAKEFVDTLEQANSDSLKSMYSDVATKTDIKELELKIEQVKSDMLKWFIGSFIVLVLMILGLYAAILLKR